jgi:hypothetical protein
MEETNINTAMGRETIPDIQGILHLEFGFHRVPAAKPLVG